MTKIVFRYCLISAVFNLFLVGNVFAQGEPNLIIFGQTAEKATVTIIVNGLTEAATSDENGFFKKELFGIKEGVAVVTIYATKDAFNSRETFFTIPIMPGVIASVSDIILEIPQRLSPDLLIPSLVLAGQTAQEATVVIEIDQSIVRTATSKEDGTFRKELFIAKKGLASLKIYTEKDAIKSKRLDIAVNIMPGLTTTISGIRLDVPGRPIPPSLPITDEEALFRRADLNFE